LPDRDLGAGSTHGQTETEHGGTGRALEQPPPAERVPEPGRTGRATTLVSSHTHLFVASIYGSNGTDDRDLKLIRRRKNMPRGNPSQF
jgi:hypothetical protein